MSFILFVACIGQAVAIRKLWQENKWLTDLMRTRK
jgi:hypothetical protein